MERGGGRREEGGGRVEGERGWKKGVREGERGEGMLLMFVAGHPIVPSTYATHTMTVTPDVKRIMEDTIREGYDIKRGEEERRRGGEEERREGGDKERREGGDKERREGISGC